MSRVAGRIIAAVGLLAAAVLPMAGAAPKSKNKTPLPATHLTLASLGVPGISAAVVGNGLSMLTLNILDKQHLLVTFSSRKLIPRVKDDPENHQDRIVTAEVVELPTGKVLAQTDWHMHDQGRYLWPVGHGRFVVRIGDALSLLDPMATLKEAEPLQRMSLAHQRGSPLGVTLSPDGEILSIVTELPAPKSAQAMNGDPDPDAKPRPEYAIDFYRMQGAGTDASPLQITGAGAMKAPMALVLPLDADGYLWAVDEGKGHWDVTFNEFGGKSVPVGAVDSSCPPRLKMVSRSQYVALACRATADDPKLMAIGLDGHEVWEEDLNTLVESPAYMFAPGAGRFAVSLMTTNMAGATDAATALAGASTVQEVRVYQTESGDLLLKIPCTPVFRIPENFDLSEDGRMLAVVRDDAIETYDLPAPSKRDLEDLAEVEKFRPPVSTAPVTMAKMTEAPLKKVEASSVAQQASVTAPVSTTTEAARVASPVMEKGQTIVNGDGTSGVRKRPTLLNPGEVPEFKDKTTAPQ